jgi:hypothetical protein
MPGVYEKMGIRFLYPENWIVDEEEAPQDSFAVTVYSPRGAFWSIVAHPASSDPKALATAALKTLQTEYPDSEAEPVAEQIGGQTIDGYDLSFFYLDFTNTALIRGFRTASASCLVLCQAEDREFVELAPVFRAITTSLLAEC